jgi:hypothetical protein
MLKEVAARKGSAAARDLVMLELFLGREYDLPSWSG